MPSVARGPAPQPLGAPSLLAVRGQHLRHSACPTLSTSSWDLAGPYWESWVRRRWVSWLCGFAGDHSGLLRQSARLFLGSRAWLAAWSCVRLAGQALPGSLEPRPDRASTPRPRSFILASACPAHRCRSALLHPPPPVPATSPLLVPADHPFLRKAAAVHCATPAPSLPRLEASCFRSCALSHSPPWAACLCPRQLPQSPPGACVCSDRRLRPWHLLPPPHPEPLTSSAARPAVLPLPSMSRSWPPCRALRAHRPVLPAACSAPLRCLRLPPSLRARHGLPPALPLHPHCGDLSFSFHCFHGDLPCAIVHEEASRPVRL